MSKESRQVRAVFLAAIMVISVFAAGIAFSGSAAAADSSAEIRHANESAPPGETGGTPLIAAQRIKIAPNSQNFTIDSGTTFVIENSTGQTVTVDPDSSALPVDAQSVSFEIYDESGISGSTGSITVATSSGNVDINAALSGNISMFSSGVSTTVEDPDSNPFDSYTVQLVQDGSVISTTGERTVGIGYNLGDGIQQNSTTGNIELTIPRDRLNDGFDDSWYVDFELSGPGLDTVGPVEVNNEADAANFSVVVNASNVEAGTYGYDLRLFTQEPEGSSAFGNQDDLIVGLFQFDAVTIEDGSSSTDDTDSSTTDGTLTVDADGGTDAYDTIQAAVNNASSGDTIVVEAGTYDENVTVSASNITLEGPYPSTSGDSDTRGNSEAVINGNIEIEADNTSVRGFTVSPTTEYTANTSRAAAIFVTGSDVLVENNIVTEVRGNASAAGSFSVHGVQVFKQSPSRIEDITVSNNLIEDIDNVGGTEWTNYGGAVGVKVQNRLDDVHVQENTIQDIHSAGWTYGVVSSPSSKNTVQPTNILIVNNVIEGVGDGSEYNVLEDEGAAPYPGVAVGLDTAGGSVQEDPVADASEVTATNNNFINTPVGVQNKDLSATLTAIENWWGSANGPSAGSENTYNDGNQGAEVSDNVQFTPWLDASTDNGGQEFAPVTNDSGGQFASVQSAIDVASADDTIIVSSGTYEESVTIESGNVSLVGNDNPTIVGEGIEEEGGSRRYATIHVPSSTNNPTKNVEVTGFTIQNPEGTYGIYVGSGGSGANVTGLEVTDNHIENIGTQLIANDTGYGSSPPLSGAISGLYVRADYDGILVEDNVVTNVRAPSDAPGRATGLSFSSFVGDGGGDDGKPAFSTGIFAEDTVVRNNTIREIVSPDRTKGVAASGEFDGMTVEDNDIDNIDGKDGNAFGITFTENPNGGDIDGDGNAERVGPRNFTITGNDVDGINATYPAALFIGGYEDLGDAHSVSNNNFRDGTVNRFAGKQTGYQIGDGDVLNAENNYWGAASGPNGAVNPPSNTDNPATLPDGDGIVVFTNGADGDGNPQTGLVDVTPWLDAPVPNGGATAPVTNNDTGELYPTIQAAVDDASRGDTVVVDAGTYDGFEITTRNVTVTGQRNDTVIQGLVTVDAQEAELREVRVDPPTFGPGSESQAVLVTASEATVDDAIVEIDVEVNQPDGFFEAQAIQVFASDSNPISDVVISDNVVIGTATQSNDALAGVTGVSDQGNTTDTLIVNNDIDVAGQGYSFGVVTRASGGSNAVGTPSSEVLFNDITAIGGTLNGVGYGIESAENPGAENGVAQVDAEAQFVRYNNFEDIDAIEHKTADGTLDLTVNNWEDPGEVQFLTDAFGSEIQDGGQIVYDPVLTEEKSVNQFNELLAETDEGETVATTRDYGSYLQIGSNGEPSVIGFSARPDGNLTQVLPETVTNPSGDKAFALYVYDNEAQQFVPIDGSYVPGAGEVVVITASAEFSADFVVPVDAGDGDTTSFDAPAPPSQIQIYEGWNLIATGAANSPEDPIVSSEILVGAQIQTQPAQPGAPVAEVQAYDGTWIFANDDGVLTPGYVEGQPPVLYSELVLTPDTDDDSN